MTEITFQFVPSGSISDNSAIYVDRDSGSDVVVKEGGITSIRLDKHKQLEFSEMGSIRYTVRTGDMDSINLKQMFESAKNSIQGVLHTDVSGYTVCLLISGENPVQAYMDEKNRIQTFGEDELNCRNPSYSELNNKTIKLSFRRTPLLCE